MEHFYSHDKQLKKGERFKTLMNRKIRNIENELQKKSKEQNELSREVKRKKSYKYEKTKNKNYCDLFLRLSN